MICKSFEEMEGDERKLFIAKLSQSVQSDERLFRIAVSMIDIAKDKGYFEGVTFFPQQNCTKDVQGNGSSEPA